MELELLNPGNSQSQNAFHFVHCGASLLSFFTEPDSFPSEDRRTQRRGAKWIRKDFGTDGGRKAAIFLSQGLAVLLAEMASETGHQTDAEISLQLRQLIQNTYPLDEETIGKLEACRAEYRTRETFEVRTDVARGAQSTTGYHLALLDRDFLDGMHPEEDHQMVDAQRRYASDYARGMAGLVAIEIALGHERFSLIEDELFPPVGTSSSALTQRMASLAWWADVAKDWQRYAQIALGG